MGIDEYLRVPIQIEQLIQFSQDELDMYVLYVYSDFEIVTADTVFYLDGYCEVDDADNEIYPPFVVKNNLLSYFHGDIASDIIANTRHQLKPKIPNADDYIKNFNYYNKHDCFVDFAKR